MRYCLLRIWWRFVWYLTWAISSSFAILYIVTCMTYRIMFSDSFFLPCFYSYKTFWNGSFLDKLSLCSKYWHLEYIWKIAGCHPLKKIGHLTPKTPPKGNYVKKTPQKKLTFCQILSKKDTRSFNLKPICKSFVVILMKSVFSCVSGSNALFLIGDSHFCFSEKFLQSIYLNPWKNKWTFHVKKWAFDPKTCS